MINMAVNKVIYNGNTLIDLTAVTVTADVLLDGYTAYDASGNLITGTYGTTTYTNQIPISTDSDGTAYNGGTGYKSGYRLNSSGNESAASGKYVTGFMPVSQGQTVTCENMQINTATQDNNYIAFYDSNFALLSGCSRYAYAWVNQSGDAIKPLTTDSNNYLTSFTVTGTSTYDFSNVAYFRIACNLIDSTSAIYVE